MENNTDLFHKSCIPWQETEESYSVMGLANLDHSYLVSFHRITRSFSSLDSLVYELRLYPLPILRYWYIHISGLIYTVSYTYLLYQYVYSADSMLVTKVTVRARCIGLLNSLNLSIIYYATVLQCLWRVIISRDPTITYPTFLSS